MRRACAYPGSKCVAQAHGAYDAADAEECDRACIARDVRRADEPSLESVMAAASKRQVTVRYSRRRGRIGVATTAIPAGALILSGRAVTGPTKADVGILLLLPQLLMQLPQLVLLQPVPNERVVSMLTGLVPRSTMDMVCAVAGNMLSSATGFALSVPFSMLEHACESNAAPTVVLDEHSVPRIQVSAIRDIAAGEPIRVSYGACDALPADYGFTCGCGNDGTGIPRGADVGVLQKLVSDMLLWRRRLQRVPTTTKLPDVGSLRAFADAVSDAVEAVELATLGRRVTGPVAAVDVVKWLRSLYAKAGAAEVVDEFVSAYRTGEKEHARMLWHELVVSQFVPES
jgi:hypothetical protein